MDKGSLMILSNIWLAAYGLSIDMSSEWFLILFFTSFILSIVVGLLEKR